MDFNEWKGKLHSWLQLTMVQFTLAEYLLTSMVNQDLYHSTVTSDSKHEVCSCGYLACHFSMNKMGAQGAWMQSILSRFL